MFYWALGVVCLVALLTGAHACCGPDSYAVKYDIDASGFVPNGGPRGQPTKFDADFKGSGMVDWPREKIHLNLAGTVHLEGGETKASVEVQATVSVIDGEKVLVQVLAPAMGQSMCKIWNLKGGVPKTIQCLTDSLREVAPNTYTAPSDNEIVRLVATVTNDCHPESLSITADGVPTGHFKIKVTELSLGEFNADPDLPEDCEEQEEELEFPSILPDGERKRSLHKRDLFNEGLTRLVREIGKEVAKRRPGRKG